MCGVNTGNCIEYCVTVVLFSVCTGYIVRCVLCIVVSCVVCIVVCCVVCIVVCCVVCIFVSCLVCIVVVVFVYCCSYLMCICCTVCVLLLFTLDVGLLASSQYSGGPATGHLDTGFSRFPCAYKQTLRRFPTFQDATTCFSCSPPDLNLSDPNFIFMYMHNNHCHRTTAHLQLNILLL